VGTYISKSHDLICSGNGGEMCEICPRSVDNLEIDWGKNLPHNSILSSQIKLQGKHVTSLKLWNARLLG